MSIESIFLFWLHFRAYPYTFISLCQVAGAGRKVLYDIHECTYMIPVFLANLALGRNQTTFFSPVFSNIFIGLTFVNLNGLRGLGRPGYSVAT